MPKQEPSVPRGTVSKKKPAVKKKRKKARRKSAKKKPNPYPEIKPHAHFGRPRKYRTEYCDLLIEHMKQGGSFQAFSATIGDIYGIEAAPGLSTMKDWVKIHPDFSAAKQIAEDYGRQFYDRVGNQGMTGQLRRVAKEEFAYDENGEKTVKNIEYAPATFNSRVWQTMMKNRFNFRDKVEFSGEVKTPTYDRGDAIKAVFSDPKLLAAVTKVAEAVSAESDDDDE